MDNLHVLKASAGSGKTFTLARQYIENLLWKPATGNSKAQFRNESEYHSHILAITFTNKATDEMKSRIIKELYKLTLKKGQHIDYFVTKYGNTKEEIAQEAKKALREILFNYSTFHVSTIDSFFQQVLRTFAHELDQEYNYDLELDEEFALKNAIHNFFLTLGTKKQNKDIDKWVTDYLKEDTKKDGTWNIFSEYNEEKIKKFTKVINTERFRKHREEIIAYLADPKKINEFKKKLVEARNKRISDWEQRKGHSPQEFINLVTKLGRDVNNLKSNSIWRKFLKQSYTYEEGKKLYDSFKKENIKKIKGTKGFEDLDDAAAQQLLDYRDRVINEYKRIEMLKEATKDIWKLGLLGQIENKLEEYRKDNNTVLIADTNDLISKVIESGVPFMYERLGTWLNTFMLDEFQDTSEKQYSNFLPLLEESLSRDNNPSLIIGDEKQSIYRFRNSNPDLLQNQVEQDLGGYICRTDKPLTINWRSLPKIIDFNNLLFEKIIQHYKNNKPQYTKLIDTYKNIEQKHSGKYDDCPTKGFAKVNFIYSEKETKEKHITKGIKDEEGNFLKDKEQVLHYLPQYINEIRGRGYECRDIIILVNSHDDGFLIIKRLLEYNSSFPTDDPQRIEIMSEELLKLNNASSVRLIISVLRFIDSTIYTANEDNVGDEDDNKETKKQKDNYVKNCLREQKLYRVLHKFEKLTAEVDNEADLGEYLVKSFDSIDEADNNEENNADSAVDNYAAELNSILNTGQSQQLNLIALVESIIKVFLLNNNNNTYTQKETIFLMAFQNYVLNFSQQHNGATVHEFLRYWDLNNNKITVKSPSDANAIEIMTIHAAKGLEAPCVIVPFANWDMVKMDETQWLPQDIWINKNDSKKPIEDIGDYTIVPPLIPLQQKFVDIMPELASYNDRNKEESLIDNLNKTYVALTRPRQELHIFAFVNVEKVDNYGTVGNLLFKYVPKINGIKVETEKDKDGNDFMRACVLGNKVEVKLVEEDDDKDDEAVEIPMPPYTVQNYPEQLKVSIPLLPDTKRDIGRTMHNFLSQINSIDNAGAMLEQWVKQGLITTEPDDKWNKKQVEKLIDEIRKNTTLATWFDPKNTVYNERTITCHWPANTEIDPRDKKAMRRLPDGTVVENRRPDRIIVTPQGTTVVIDYKFGKEQDNHVGQVKRYIEMLQKCGLDNIKGYLWYVHKHKIVEV